MNYLHTQVYYMSILIRSTPVETLHTILLGPCKYLLHQLMSSLSTQQKNELNARLQAFSLSGIDQKVLGNFTRNYRSFVGRDYKAWIQVSHNNNVLSITYPYTLQVAIFLVRHYLSEQQLTVWLNLSKACPYTE